jgi:hypothetical protein
MSAADALVTIDSGPSGTFSLGQTILVAEVGDSIPSNFAL